MSFFKYVAAILLVATGLVYAQSEVDMQSVQDDIDKETAAFENSSSYWIDKSRRLIDDAEKAEMPSWLKTESTSEVLIAAEKLRKRAESLQKNVTNGMSVKDAVKEWKTPGAVKSTPEDIERQLDATNDELARSYIFVSQSMPIAELTAAAEESTESGSILVFRGIKPGQAIDHVAKIFMEIVKKNKTLTPHVIIEPSLYKQYGVDSAPTAVVHLNGKMVQASGTLSIDYLLAQLEENKTGNLGVVGSTYEVAEPDMIEEMKRRTALIDWEAQTKGAVGRFWTDSWGNLNMPLAEKNTAFLVDPTFVLSKDIVAQGTTLARAGSMYNPQKIMPMRQTMFVFDGTDKKQLSAIKKYIKTKKITIENVVLIVSEIDRIAGFDALEELQKYFGTRVFVIDKSIKDRFKLRAVPSVIYGSGEYYKVEELGMSEK